MSLEMPSVVSTLLSLIVLCLQSTCYLPILLHSRQQTQRLAGFAPSPHTEKKKKGVWEVPDIVGHGQIYQLISLVFLSLIISNCSCHSQVLFHWGCYVCWSAFHCIEASEKRSGFCPTVMVLPGHAQLFYALISVMCQEYWQNKTTCLMTRKQRREKERVDVL